MTRDLRRRALESHKTTSRRAQAKLGSADSSAKSSPAASRIASRNPSDDEQDFSDSATNFSVTSVDDLLQDDFDQPMDVWVQNLNNRIEQIIDRKRSSVQGREESLVSFTHILMAHYAREEIEPRLSELIPAILRSVKAGDSEQETILALHAVSLIVVTCPVNTMYEDFSRAVKRLIQDSEYPAVKADAIDTLAVAAFFGGAGQEEIEAIMSFFLQVVETDGEYIDAHDTGDVVTAALEQWGFLSTIAEGLEDTVEEKMEVLVEQLDSSDASVQIACGENIALMFEKACSELAQGEEKDDNDIDTDENDPSAPVFRKRYTVYAREDQLKLKLVELAGLSTKRVSKKNRKSLHSTFGDVINTMEYPNRGPCYSTAIDDSTGKPYGSRMTLGIGKNDKLTITSWEQLHRLKALRRVLHAGLVVHYSENDIIFETLPVMLH
ncbi:hypothetical protein MBLNU457_7606t1 [Dothideomycetes sp. NU457]